MKIPRKIFSDLTKVLLAVGAWKVTKYYTDKDVVTATRRCYGRKIDKRDTRVEILFKVGRPNFEEREFIKKCKKAGEPFPVKRIQIKYLPKKK